MTDAPFDELLEAIEAADERGDPDQLRTLVAEGRTRFPDAIELRGTLEGLAARLIMLDAVDHESSGGSLV